MWHAHTAFEMSAKGLRKPLDSSGPALTRVTDLQLRGAGGEPVDFARTIMSHGWRSWRRTSSSSEAAHS
jgi:hypothetical protein